MACEIAVGRCLFGTPKIVHDEQTQTKFDGQSKQKFISFIILASEHTYVRGGLRARSPQGTGGMERKIPMIRRPSGHEPKGAKDHALGTLQLSSSIGQAPPQVAELSPPELVPKNGSVKSPISA